MALKGMRVKARDNKNYGTTRVEFDSAKNRCKIVSQSMLEYIEYMRLEFDPEVISYVPHPGEILIEDAAGEKHRSVFDAEVHMTDGSLIYEEIKYSKEIKEGNDSNDPFRSLRQIEFQKKWCDENGYEYRVVTEKELAAYPALLNNCLFITQRLRYERIDDISVIAGLSESVYTRITEKGGSAVISSILYDPGDIDEIENTMTAVCDLLLKGRITADIEKEDLFIGSEVRING